MNRRQFLRNSSALTTAAALGRLPLAWAQTQPPADYTLRIAPIHLEIAPERSSGQQPSMEPSPARCFAFVKVQTLPSTS